MSESPSNSQRLYYHDAYIREFDAQVVDVADDGRRVYLDRSAFYPTSGGQPFDVGYLNGVPVIDVVDEEERVAHILTSPLEVQAVHAQIDWARRFDHMQQHTGQHLLSAVLHSLFNVATVSFHLGTTESTIDLATPTLSYEQLVAAETRANEIVFENRPVSISFEEANQAQDLRKASERAGTLRIITIADLDRSACGGTHVRSTGEIGPILLGKLDKVRGNMRLEFLCGHRAIRRARSDYDSLQAAAKHFSAPAEDVPALVRSTLAKLADSEKSRKKFATEVAVNRGKARYQQTPISADDLRRLLWRVDAIDDEVRSEAQGFISGEKAAVLVVAESGPSILLGASPDAGLHAGNRISEVIKPLGGRGGGNATIAQATAPSIDALNAAVQKLGFGV
ncbi:MAG TPA: DHHA1 domain-containing protein [Bryobacteraceae bacterium]|nr:DHHA1 domain-containing protein [Bryobacteraceae bacterium]